MLTAEEVLELLAKHRISVINSPDYPDRFILTTLDTDAAVDALTNEEYGYIDGHIKNTVITNDLTAGVAQWVEDYAQ